MLDLGSLLRARAAYGGRFDAHGRLLVISDLANVPQVWATSGGGGEGEGESEGAWPELVLAPPDRAQTLHPGPLPGQLAVGADVGGNEHTQVLLSQDGSGWTPLVDDPAHIYTFGAWSRDGRLVSYATNTRTGRWFDVFVRDLASGQAWCVLQDDSTNRARGFSPDGRWLLVERSLANFHQQLWLVDLAGADPPRRLTPPTAVARFAHPAWTPDGSAVVVLTDLDRDLAAPARLDITSGEISFLVEPEHEVDECALSPDGAWLAYALNRDGAAEVRARHLETGRERSVPGLPPGALYDYWQAALAWSPAGDRLALSWTASRYAPNVWIYHLASSQTHPATRTPMAGIRPDQLAEPEHVTYPTFDERSIPALFYPPGQPAASPPPCVLFVHGGPEGQYRPTWQPLVQSLVSAGFAVLAPNVRGSAGYGKAYLHLDDVRLRMDAVADLAHAATWLRASGRADPTRLGVYGGSYGGFMVLAALTEYPDLWAAGVDVVGIANFVTFLHNTGPWRRHLREAEYGSLEHDRAFLESISPIHKVDRIRAPLLVVHGANDPRVPISEAEQMVASLRALGRTVDLIRLEDEGHQIAKLKNKLVVFPRVARFLAEHLQDPSVSRPRDTGREAVSPNPALAPTG